MRSYDRMVQLAVLGTVLWSTRIMEAHRRAPAVPSAGSDVLDRMRLYMQRHVVEQIWMTGKVARKLGVARIAEIAHTTIMTLLRRSASTCEAPSSHSPPSQTPAGEER